jgi:hypothetical protein
VIVGLVLAFSPPKVDITFVPLSPAAASTEGHDPLSAPVRAASVQGGAVQLAF